MSESFLDLYKRPCGNDNSIIFITSRRQLILFVQPSTPIKLDLGACLYYQNVRLVMVNIFMVNKLLEEKLKVEITEFKKKISLNLQIELQMSFIQSQIILVNDRLNIHLPFALCETFKPEEAKKMWDRT
jgi:hypothetical protein